MYAMKIRYFHTLYQREVTDNVFGKIRIENGKAIFASMGHMHAIELEYVISIEPLDN